MLSSYPPKFPLDIELRGPPFVKLNDMADCCEPRGGGGVAPGVDATDWEALNDPIWDWDNCIPLADPTLFWEYDMERLGRGV